MNDTAENTNPDTPLASADASGKADRLPGWPDTDRVLSDVDIYPNLYEARIPDCGAPYPDGLNDPVSRNLVDTARWFLSFLVDGFWSPASLARLEQVWQWRKFDFLDWLRPIELLLRRLLLIEALGLILAQTLPPPRPSRARKAGAGKDGAIAPAKPPFDPDYPETWRVSFTCLPRTPSPGRPRLRRRRLPPANQDQHELPWKLRSRRVLHNAVPLALRLEAAIRVTLDPAKYARRLALRLQRRRNRNAALLVIPRRRDFPRPAPRETLVLAGDRAAALHHEWWSSA